ncbi:hypothetical protein NP493_619g00027 [Ridgeia piscesae]|uniref:BTB domain-containing protein n=1 Tax=Ridgeia piscesae TaxID=27915 RepID=A0AAD9NNN5_RIDPI|nr:hypothetical protein NP493_619g00027 [Ridgeia piscesae]
MSSKLPCLKRCYKTRASAPSKVNKFVDTAYQNGFMKGMNRQRQKGEFTDVTLKSGDVQLRCHRVVLAVASDYFKATFRRRPKEGTTNTYELPVEPEALVSVVDYIYTGEIELTIDNVEGLVRAADVLQLRGLKATCENYMAAQIELGNMSGFNRPASFHGGA